MKRTIQSVIGFGLVGSIFLQAFLFAMHAPNFAIAQAARAGPLSSIIVICTGTSLKKVILDRNGSPVELPNKGSVGETCQICASVCEHDAATPASAVAVDAPCRSARAFSLSGGHSVSDRRPFVRCGHDPPIAT
ncbi:MAG: hypothetical protein ACR2PA_16950 [Hyphomicrobiaceae bacterium]